MRVIENSSRYSFSLPEPCFEMEAGDAVCVDPLQPQEVVVYVGRRKVIYYAFEEVTPLPVGDVGYRPEGRYVLAPPYILRNLYRALTGELRKHRSLVTSWVRFEAMKPDGEIYRKAAVTVATLSDLIDRAQFSKETSVWLYSLGVWIPSDPRLVAQIEALRQQWAPATKE